MRPKHTGKQTDRQTNKQTNKQQINISHLYHGR